YCFSSRCLCLSSVCLLFTSTATSALYTLSLHDALPICGCKPRNGRHFTAIACRRLSRGRRDEHGHCYTAGGRESGRLPECHGIADRKSTRLNSSHDQISYAVFCLKKKTMHGQSSVVEER